MSSKIKVDTIENVAGSGNVSLGSGHNLVVPGNVTGQGTLAVTGATTLTGNLTVDTNTLHVDATNNKVAIGTASPNTGASAAVLQINKDGEALRIDGTADTAREIFFRGVGTSNVASIHSDGSLKIRAEDSGTHLELHTADSERMRLQSDGRVSIGTSSANSALYVYANSTRSGWGGGWMQRLHNDGNANNLYGLEIMCGKDDGSGTNSAIRIATGDGSDQGDITFSGGTVTYGAFTAMHHCIIPDADNTPTSIDNAYPYGTLLEVTSIQYTKQKSTGADTERGIVYNVKKTQSANSKKVLGAYGSSMNQGPSNHTNMHQVLVLGDGHILCNNSGGNISIGDGICSSSTEGIGCKATASPSMIIGLAQEDITFSGSETKLVAVQYGLRQFTPWS